MRPINAGSKNKNLDTILKKLKELYNKDSSIKVTIKYIMDNFKVSRKDASALRISFNEWLSALKIANLSPKKGNIGSLEGFEELSEQEKVFCLEYLKSYNVKNAAVKAGYSPTEGVILIRKPKVSKALKAYQDKRETDLYVDGLEVIKMYIGIAFADITDYVDFGTEEIPLLDGYGKPVIDDNGNVTLYTRNYIRLKDSTKVDGRLIQEVTQGKNGVSLKLFDKTAALDKIAKIFDIYNDNDLKALQIEINKAKLEQERAKARLLGEVKEKDIEIRIYSASQNKEVVI